MLNRTSSGYKSLKQKSLGDVAIEPSDDLMAPPARTTPFLIYLAFIVTLGPLLFGYHLVSIGAVSSTVSRKADNFRESSMHLKRSSHARPTNYLPDPSITFSDSPSASP